MAEDDEELGPRALVRKLMDFMKHEQELLGVTPFQFCHENFLVYREAFNRIINHAIHLKPELAAFKAAHDELLLNMHHEMERNTCIPSEDYNKKNSKETLRMMAGRYEELKAKLDSCKTEKASLEREIAKTEKMIEDILDPSDSEDEDPFKSKLIEGFTPDQMTNINFLSREYGKLEQVFQDELNSQSANFAPRQKYDDLKESLLEKEDEKEVLKSEFVVLNRDNMSVKALLEKLSVLSQGNRLTIKELQDIVMECVVEAQSSYIISSTDIADDEGFKEEELHVACMEQFEELIREGKYAQAMTLATTSPNGFLRTMTTMELFKNISNDLTDDDFLLPYCTMLLRTVDDYEIPPEDQSLMCVEAAVNAQRYDYIAQWLANSSLTLSDEMGLLLLECCYCGVACTCEPGTLSQAVFRSLGDYVMVARSLAKQGSYRRAIDLCSKKKLGSDVMISLLRQRSTVDLASMLIFDQELPVQHVLKILVQGRDKSCLVDLLKILKERHQNLKNTLFNKSISDYLEEDDWLIIIKTCYEAKEFALGEDIQSILTSSGDVSINIIKSQSSNT